MKHRPRVVEEELYLPDGWAQVAVARCVCGWAGAAHTGKGAKAAARTDRADHCEQVAPPEHERCRDTKGHRTRWWDPCPLCADQLALIDPGELAGGAA